MLADRDIMVQAAAAGSLEDGSARGFNPEVIYCSEDQDIQEAAKLM